MRRLALISPRGDSPLPESTPNMLLSKAMFYTVQHQAAIEAARETGLLKGNPDKVSPDFEEAYRWMMRQMSSRLPAYGGGYPVWLWPEKPDWTNGSFGDPKRLALLEVRLPLHRVLYSDFQAWHAVLNRFPVLAHEQERIDMIVSWERIFDFDFLSNAPHWGAPEMQAVVEHVFLDEIVSIF